MDLKVDNETWLSAFTRHIHREHDPLMLLYSSTVDEDEKYGLQEQNIFDDRDWMETSTATPLHFGLGNRDIDLNNN